MAMINIDEDLLISKRFSDLVLKLKSKTAALGAILECYLLAQKTWIKYGRVGVPKDLWLKEAIANEIIEVGLAVDNGDFIYVKGSKKLFVWLEQKSDAGKHKNRHNQYTKQKVERTSTHVNGMEPLSLSLALKKETTTTLSSGDDLHPLAKLWNENCKSLPKVKEINPKRIKLCKLAWAKSQDHKYWQDLINKLTSSKFHTGDNDSGWVANFDYFLRPETQTKLIEGVIGEKKKEKFDFSSETPQ